MQWWDVYVQVPEDTSPAVGGYLQSLGSQGVVEYEATSLSLETETGLERTARTRGWTVLYGALPSDEFLSIRVCALQQFLATYPATSMPLQWKMQCRQRHDQAYLTQWQQFFQPFALAQRLLIRPPWDTMPVPADMEVLTLNPGMAFGTGLHPTTRMCLSLLARNIKSNSAGKMLDVGCGSGILSLAALKLGADGAVGLDIEAQAVSVARHNAMTNGLVTHSLFLHGSLEAVAAQFAWIAANIYLGPLVEMMPALVRCLAPRGCLLLSGILESQEAALRAAMQAAGLRIRYRIAEAGWVALEGEQADHGEGRYLAEEERSASCAHSDERAAR
jgi:ribosomal protein L11 methyltransferase